MSLMTVEQFHALPRDGKRYELNRAVLVTMPGAKHGHDTAGQNLNANLTPDVRGLGLGEMRVKTGFELDGPSLYREPDVSFVRAGRLASTPDDAYIQGAPDLAIEIVSPANNASDLEEKIGQYFEFGAHSVWVVYPNTRHVHVYTSARAARIFAAGDTITSDLFPGWSLAVDAVFA